MKSILFVVLASVPILANHPFNAREFEGPVVETPQYPDIEVTGPYVYTIQCTSKNGKQINTQTFREDDGWTYQRIDGVGYRLERQEVLSFPAKRCNGYIRREELS